MQEAMVQSRGSKLICFLIVNFFVGWYNLGDVLIPGLGVTKLILLWLSVFVEVGLDVELVEMLQNFLFALVSPAK